MLGDEAGARLHDPGHPELIRLDGDTRPDRVAIALRPHQTDGEDGVPARVVVAEETELGRGAGRENDEVGVAVAVVVEDGEGPAILVEVEPRRRGDVVEVALTVVAEEHVPLVLGLGPVAHEKAVGGAPAVVVGRARLSGQRRLRDDLAPEEAVHVNGRLIPVAREHAVGDVEVVPAVAVEVEGVGGPRPAAHLRSRGQGHVLEGAVAPIAEERVAAHVAAVDVADLRRRVRLEAGLRGHALAGRRPHVARVDVQVPVVVEVHEGGAHARAVVLDAGLGGHVLEVDLTVDPSLVVVEVLPAEVVRDQEVGPPVLVVIAPGGREAEPVVVLVEADRVRHVHEPPVAVVVKEHVRGAIERIVVRRRRAGLVLAHADVVAVGAEVDVQESVAVVVGHRRRGQRALQGPLELEGVRITREVALAVVQEQQGARAREEDEVLVAVVVDVHEERLGCAVEDGEARRLCHVLERAVPLVAEEAVGQALGLGDVDVVPAVAVEVAHGHAVMAHASRLEDRVEARGPGVEARDELPAKRGIASEGGRRHLGEDGEGGAAATVLETDPLRHAPGPVRAASPAELPAPEPLRAPAASSGSRDLVAHEGANERIRRSLLVDAGDEELGHRYRLEVAHQGRELRAERAAVPHEIRRQDTSAEDLELRATADGDLLGRGETTAPELRRQEPVRGLGHETRVRAEQRAELAEPVAQLLGFLLGGERVLSGAELPQDRLERRWDVVLGVVPIGAARSGDGGGQETDEDQRGAGNQPPSNDPASNVFSRT